MRGAELARVTRNDEIVRLRVEEGKSYRQIGEVVGLSYVRVLQILKEHRLAGPALEETIAERRSHLADLLERAVQVAHEKYLLTLAPADMHAFIKAVESYKSLLGLNAPTTHQFELNDGRRPWEAVYEAVLVERQKPKTIEYEAGDA